MHTSISPSCCFHAEIPIPAVPSLIFTSSSWMPSLIISRNEEDTAGSLKIDTQSQDSPAGVAGFAGLIDVSMLGSSYYICSKWFATIICWVGLTDHWNSHHIRWCMWQHEARHTINVPHAIHRIVGARRKRHLGSWIAMVETGNKRLDITWVSVNFAVDPVRHDLTWNAAALTLPFVLMGKPWILSPTPAAGEPMLPSNSCIKDLFPVGAFWDAWSAEDLLTSGKPALLDSMGYLPSCGWWASHVLMVCSILNFQALN